MLSNLNGWHLLIVILVVLLIFGAPKLPGLARSLGQSMRIFRQEVKAMKDDDEPAARKSASSTATKKTASSTASKSTSAKAGKSTSQ
jgi:sec-independent protein translocase protein TatA